MPERPEQKLWPHPRARDLLPPCRLHTHTAYVELQAKSNFSFLEGASHPEEIVHEAATLGYRSVAITDRHTLAGIVRAHVAAKKTGIRLIVGASISLTEQIAPFDENGSFTPSSAPLSLLLYPMTRKGYATLTRLLTVGKLRAPKAECYLTLEDVADHSADLQAIAVTRQANAPQLVSYLQRLQAIFRDDALSLAITTNHDPRQRKNISYLAALGERLRIPLVATNDVHYHSPQRRMLQDALTCVRHGCAIHDAGYLLYGNAERFLKAPEEMARLFRKRPDAVLRTAEVAERTAGFSLDQLSYEYPHEICPDGLSPTSYLREVTMRAMRERYPNGTPENVRSQVEHELRLIADLNYEKYFLTVYDIVSFARRQNILCQGRGAAANSAVCYVLGITSVDPAQIKLLFERFVSKERNEPPDIDIDFEHERREEVIQYIYNRFGRHRAALVAEVITYRVRSAIRDIGKVFSLPIGTVEALIRLQTRHGKVTDDALREAQLDPDHPAIRRTLELSLEILGFPRHLSQHVGGFVVSETPLSEIVPIENAAMPERTVIEWDKDDIESMGMLKIDCLGLGMLTAIRKGFELLNAREADYPSGRALPLALHTVPPEDPRVYDMICKADTIGVFQIESRAQMSMLPRLQPRCFYDLVIEVAIVRPGPIQGGMVHPYLRRRAGREPVTYPDARIAGILERTLGVPIFQEQVMELAVVAAGFTPGEADHLRRAMASWKRNKNALLAFRERLLTGMARNGYPADFAESLFEQIQGFGEYGFPQSHSASFALLVYASAWLKCHHPAAFAAALLNSQPMGFYQPAQLVQDARAHGAEIRDVDVNHSRWDCTLEGAAPALRLGLRMVRGAQQTEMTRIADAVRREGPFATVLDLWRASGVRIEQLRLLARADAFRSLGLDRQQALWAIKRLRDEHLPLFDSAKEREELEANLPPIRERQHVLRDYASTGLSLRGHPLAFYRRSFRERGVLSIAEMKDPRRSPHGSRISVAGMVLVRQRPGTANGVMFMTIEDETGMGNLIVRPSIRARFPDALLDSPVIIASGIVQRVENVLHLLVESAESASDGRPAALQSRDFR